MANRFWVDCTGTWDSTNTTNWSTTTGGAGGASVPSTGDVALFDGSSGAGTVTLGYDPTVQSVNMAGYTGTFNGVGTTYTITLNSTGQVWSGAGTINGSPNITLSNTSTTARTFAGGGKTYGKLTIGGATGTSTLTISGVNTFSEIASTKTVAHTINLQANQTINTWSVTGSSGNVVVVTSNSVSTLRTLTITNRTSGIDYLEVSALKGNLTPVTFYVGANSSINFGSIGIAGIAPTTDEFIYVLDTGTSFTVPADWNSSNNEIHLFAGGGGGRGGAYTAPNSGGGAGGGGGGYTKVSNLTLTPSSSVSYAIGAGGGTGSSGGNTTFNAGAHTTTGGGGAVGNATSSTGGTAGTGSTFNGGAGGAGSLNTVSNGGACAGGGGGAGGPLGVGANGGNASLTAGGGGGGNGGGTNGSNATSSAGGNGGNNNAGVGGGAGSTSSGVAGTGGFSGGGGGGGYLNATGSRGSVGVDIAKAGMGSGGASGGSGYNSSASTTSQTGLFGAGGPGGGVNTANNSRVGGPGAQGGIIIVYNAGAAPVSNSNFFLMFG